MTTAIQEMFKLDVLRRFYVERKSKCQIADELRCSRTTVRKYIKEYNEDSDLVLSFKKPIESPLAIPDEEKGIEKLQRSIHEAIEDGPRKLDYKVICQMAKEYVEYFGISNPVDLLKIEIAFYNYIEYRKVSQRISFLNGHSLDPNWLKSADKLAKIYSKMINSEQKYLKNFLDGIKELEIKYNKRSPDFGRIQTINIQSNEFNTPLSSRTPKDVENYEG